MIQFTLLVMFVLHRAALGAPAYGADGGYIGYAGYDPSRGRQFLSGELSPAAEVEGGNDHPGAFRRNKQGGKSQAPSIAPPLSTAGQHGGNENDSFDPIRMQNDYPLTDSGKNTEPLKDNYIVPHYDTQFGHNGGYKISDVAPKVKENVYSDDYHPQDTQPYEYGYVITDEHGNVQSKKESSDGHKVQGSYGYTNEDGLFRKVDYVADGDGFRARVRTNEPGTDNQNPADVLIESEHVVSEP